MPSNRAAAAVHAIAGFPGEFAVKTSVSRFGVASPSYANIKRCVDRKDRYHDETLLCLMSVSIAMHETAR